jgi:glyoxylase-like metal-dependent hydrolase (beta-lactamase superfamily II)
LYAVKTGTVNFYVYTGGSGAVCFDSGFGRRRIIEGLRSLNIDPASVTHVFLTHSDFDHAGGVKLLNNAKVYLSADEEQMIKREKARMGIFRNSRIKREYTLLRDGDVVSTSGVNVRAIATPGHTPGSM